MIYNCLQYLSGGIRTLTIDYDVVYVLVLTKSFDYCLDYVEHCQTFNARSDFDRDDVDPQHARFS